MKLDKMPITEETVLSMALRPAAYKMYYVLRSFSWETYTEAEIMRVLRMSKREVESALRELLFCELLWYQRFEKKGYQLKFQPVLIDPKGTEIRHGLAKAELLNRIRIYHHPGFWKMLLPSANAEVKFADYEELKISMSPGLYEVYKDRHQDIMAVSGRKYYTVEVKK